MRHVLLGFLSALLASIGFSLLFSLMICWGVNPEARTVSDAASPFLGIFTGAYFASRKATWNTGVWIGLVFVALWFGFWLYVMGRVDPLLWIEEGLPHLTMFHLFWWVLSILTGVIGGFAGRMRLPGFLGLTILLSLGLLMLVSVAGRPDIQLGRAPVEPVPGYQVERQSPKEDQTTTYILTFDFQKKNRFVVGLYDCDSDDTKPYDDFNTTYMGESLDGLVNKLDQKAQATHRELLCTIIDVCITG